MFIICQAVGKLWRIKTSMEIIGLWVKQALIHNLTRKCTNATIIVVGR